MSNQNQHGRKQPYRFAKASTRLRMERLEDRRMRAILVDTLTDEADGSILDGDVSLRDAIAVAAPGETIEFEPALTAGGPAVLQLSLGQFEIDSDLQIVGPGAELLTIDARRRSRIFDIDDDDFDNQINVEIRSLSIISGDGPSRGGAIYNGGEALTLASVSISNSEASYGGALWSQLGDVVVSQSVISDNIAQNSSGGGGGIRIQDGTLRIHESTISGNTATSSRGGGIYNDGGEVVITNSTISGNESSGYGGGIWSLEGDLTVVESTISNNEGSNGSGIRNQGGSFNLIASTVSANQGRGTNVVAVHSSMFVVGSFKTNINNSTVSGNMGGGVFVEGHSTSDIEVRHSTIAFNSGDGIRTSSGSRSVKVYSSIIIDNTHQDLDIQGSSTTAFQSLGYNLIGGGHSQATGVFTQTGDERGVNSFFDVKLGPLADNGGPTETHALMTSSDAIDAGSPSTLPGVTEVPLFDQRGNNYGRVQNGRIDIGAFEVREPSSADFDGNGNVNGIDFLLWQRGLGTPAPDADVADGDADNDLDSDHSDLAVWKLEFGNASPSLTALSIPFQTPSLSGELSAEYPTNELTTIDLAAAAKVVDKSNETTSPVTSERQAFAQDQSAYPLLERWHFITADASRALSEFSDRNSMAMHNPDYSWLVHELVDEVFGMSTWQL